MSNQMLLVEDELPVVRLVTREFEARGWTVWVATRGAEAKRQLSEHCPDVILLDVGLPDTSGFDLCREIRQDPVSRGIPIIFLTGMNDEVDRVVGLELGADDYVGKPFGIRELEARVRAVLRRAAHAAARPAPGEPDEASLPDRLVFADLTIDAGTRLVLVEGHEVRLRAREFELLLAMARCPGHVHRRADLLRQVWTYDRPAEVVTRTVDVHVRRLREKLGTAAWHLETVKGVGYRFVPERM